jgi:hypothetical protein
MLLAYWYLSGIQVDYENRFQVGDTDFSGHLLHTAKRLWLRLHEKNGKRQ